MSGCYRAPLRGPEEAPTAIDEVVELQAAAADVADGVARERMDGRPVVAVGQINFELRHVAAGRSPGGPWAVWEGGAGKHLRSDRPSVRGGQTANKKPVRMGPFTGGMSRRGTGTCTNAGAAGGGGTGVLTPPFVPTRARVWFRAQKCGNTGVAVFAQGPWYRAARPTEHPLQTSATPLPLTHPPAQHTPHNTRHPHHHSAMACHGMVQRQ